jgi:hypothetical protein
MTYMPTARPGSRAPHIWLAPDVSTLDLFGREYVLLKLDPSLDVSLLAEAAKRRKMPFKTVELTDRAVRDAYIDSLILVRPDGFVCWRSDRLPDDPSGLIDIVRGESFSASAEKTESGENRTAQALSAEL